jgi:hypothetical protein
MKMEISDHFFIIKLVFKFFYLINLLIESEELKNLIICR